MKRWSVAIVLFVTAAFGGGLVLGPMLHGQAAPQTNTAIPKEMTSFRDVVKKVLPAVVSIEATSKPKPAAKLKNRQNDPRPLPFDDPRVPDDFRKFFDGQFEMPDVPRHGFGSGFFVDPSGV